MKMCGIYKITNMVNGKVYIGQSVNIEDRWRCHKSNMNYKNHTIYKAMRKYGFENFKFEVIEECRQEDLNNLEIYYIWYYNSYMGNKNHNGYNETAGGGGSRGYIPSEETRKKISEINSGENNANSKKVACEDSMFPCARKCAEYYGVNYSTMRSWLNHSVPMPLYWYNKGLRYEDEDINDYKVYEPYKGGKCHQSKKVICENMTFGCAREVADYYGESYSSIRAMLNGGRKMPIIWYMRGLRYADKSMEDYIIAEGLERKIYCDGIIFSSIVSFCKEYNKKHSAVMAWLTGQNNIPKEFQEMGFRYATKEESLFYDEIKAIKILNKRVDI